MVVIIDDLCRSNDLARGLNERLIKLFNTDEYIRYCNCIFEVEDCRGCFECWFRTPGLCSLEDKGREVARRIVKSQKVIIITEIIYGGYSPEVKRYLERIISIMSPLFTVRDGVVHNQSRYGKYPEFIFLGYGDDINEEEKNCFRNLTKATASNFNTNNNYKTIIVDDINKMDYIKEIVGEAL